MNATQQWSVCVLLDTLCVTWVDFPVVSDAVGVHDVLEAGGELVGLVEGGRSLFGQHPVQDGRHSGATPLLKITPPNMSVRPKILFQCVCGTQPPHARKTLILLFNEQNDHFGSQPIV